MSLLLAVSSLAVSLAVSLLPVSLGSFQSHYRCAGITGPDDRAVIGDDISLFKIDIWTPWRELLKRNFGVDGWACPHCDQRMRLRAVVLPPATHKILRGLQAAW